MGLFDALFGRNIKSAKPKKTNKAKTPAAVVEPAKQGTVKPEIIAAICASISVMIEDDAELVAAVAAAIIHARRKGVRVLRIKRTCDAWTLVGRQKLMDARQSI